MLTLVLQTPSIAACNPAKFIAKVNWMGISGVAGGWKFNINGSANAQECCMKCFTQVEEGCNAWAFMPARGFTSTACNVIFGWPSGVHMDHACPRGHADVRIARGDDPSYAGGAGPCGRIVW